MSPFVVWMTADDPRRVLVGLTTDDLSSSLGLSLRTSRMLLSAPLDAENARSESVQTIKTIKTNEEKEREGREGERRRDGKRRKEKETNLSSGRRREKRKRRTFLKALQKMVGSSWASALKSAVPATPLVRPWKSASVRNLSADS